METSRKDYLASLKDSQIQIGDSSGWSAKAPAAAGSLGAWTADLTIHIATRNNLE